MHHCLAACSRISSVGLIAAGTFAGSEPCQAGGSIAALISASNSVDFGAARVRCSDLVQPTSE